MRSSTEAVEQAEDLGDRVSVAERAKRAKTRELQKLTGLKEIMASPAGRVWMWDLLSGCGLFSVVFNGNSKDYFLLGQRNAAMPIFSEIQRHCMPEYLTMVKENANV